MTVLTVILHNQSPMYQRAEEKLADKLGIPTESRKEGDLTTFVWHGADANGLGVAADVIDSFAAAVKSVAYDLAEGP